MFYLQKLEKSFSHALRGIHTALRENTFRVLLLIAFVVFLFLLLLPFNNLEKAVLVFTIAMVLGLELINSQIERLLNVLKPDYNEEVKKIKDISAGAVLVVSGGALMIGIIIILPRLLETITRFLS